MMDRELKNIIKLENRRQRNTIELIASENFVSKEIMKLTGSVLTNKYAEGYPLKRYYGGCKEIDKVEIPKHITDKRLNNNFFDLIYFYFLLIQLIL